jgi:hypothetical protein
MLAESSIWVAHRRGSGTYYTMKHKLFVMTVSITEEAIIENKTDRDTLISNRDELIKLTKDLVQKEEQISRIEPRVLNDLRDPIKPSTFDLLDRNNYAWDTYFEESTRRIQEKKEQDKLRQQLDGLEQECKEIKLKIALLVPPSLHGTQIIVLSNRRITVNGENVL